MNATSLEVRQLIVDAYERGEGTYEEIGRRFARGRATVERLVRRWREKHSLEVVYSRVGPAAKVRDEELDDLKLFVADGRADWSAEALKDAWCALKGVTLSRSAMVRALQKAGLSSKKRASSLANKTVPTSSKSGLASAKRSSRSRAGD
jgi:transposase